MDKRNILSSKMSRTRKILIFLGILLLTSIATICLLLLVALGRTLTLKDISVYTDSHYVGQNYDLDEESFDRFIKAFCAAIKFQTVSSAPGEYNREELLKLKISLRDSFPLVFNAKFIDVEDVNTYSWLFTIKGSDPALKPYMLTSHMDVVPVDPSLWKFDPFLGEVISDPQTGEDVIWGRGAIDDKSGVLGILSALEFLISKGWSPTRSFFVGFGHDEEVSGGDGAEYISALLQERNVTLDFLLDEGLPITKGVITGIEAPVATIGVSEKGRMNVRLSVSGKGGHSSIPPMEQPVGVLATALSKIYQNQQPSMFGLGSEEDMLNYLAPKASWPYKFLFSNTWLFGPLIVAVMSAKREGNAILRTTTALTIVNAGVKDNVVPSTAWALVNHRVHPAQSLEDVLRHDKESVDDDRVKLEMLDFTESHPVSPYGPESQAYMLIANAIQNAFPEAISVPGLMVANTDTKSYLTLTPSIYRLTPIILDPRMIATIHGNDESITLTNFKSAIRCFQRLIQTAETVHLRPRRPARATDEL